MHEIELAYEEFLRATHGLVRSSSWGFLADLFTVDAWFRRAGFPELRGREEIRAMILTGTAMMPGSLTQRVDVVWHSVDAERGQVVQELRQTLCDPGDGSEHFAMSTSLLRYGGHGLWEGIDMALSAESYRTMYRGWARAARRCGRHEEAEQVERLMQDRTVGL